jgi:hypothetical protein
MHELLTSGIKTTAKDLTGGEHSELDAARDREIRMNGLESRARETLMARRLRARVTRGDWVVLELVDAYETAGNQLYRLAEALGDDALPSARVAV